tara:strand:+ start:5777 stop:6577 length:801 start_codon:yes stop_codon:yes gene_type:complete
MNKVTTKCEDCVFSKTENDKQTGCQLGRDEKLGVSETADEGYFILERFCNTYRPDQWLEDLNFEESMDTKKTVMDEIVPRIGFFIRLDTGDETPTNSELNHTLQSISQIEHGPPAFVAVINDKVEFNELIWSLFLKYFENSTTKYHIVQLKNKPETDMKHLDEAFSHAQNGWLYSTTSGESVPKDVVSKLHKNINIDMKQLMLVEPYDNYNGLMFPTFVFKFLKGNRSKIFQDEMMDSRPFLEKMKAAEKRGNTKTIFSWEEFNAS